MKKFTPQLLKQLRQDIQTALAPLAEQYGMKEILLGSISYSEFSFTGKLTGTIANEQSAAADLVMNERLSIALGFSQNIVGETIIVNRKPFTIVRIDLKKPKFPIIARNAEGVNYKFTEQHCKFTNSSITRN